MNWTQEFHCLQKAVPIYFNIGLFLVFHWIRMLLAWCHQTCIQPIEKCLQGYNKVEPNEEQWIQLFTLSQCCIGDNYGGTDEVFKSSEKYFFPYTTHFLKFVDNEFQFFLNNPMICEDEMIENLFIVKNNTQYVVKSYPVFQKITSSIDWENFPKKSEISFSFIEYYHPNMARPLEILLPFDYYTIGNELFTNAFVLRQLELMNCNFIFDKDYEIHFMDHEINETHIKYDEFIEIKENTYIVRTRNVVDEKEASSEASDNITSGGNEDDTSILSETRYWWNFGC